MERPTSLTSKILSSDNINDNLVVIKHIIEMSNYCDYLEKEISTLREEYSEQVKVTAELRSKLTTFRRIASC